MKTLMKKLLCGAALATCFSPAFAAPLYTIDTLLFSADLQDSGDATEQQALEDFLGFEVTLDSKIEDNFTVFLNDPDDPISWFLDVEPEEPGYFMLKFGTGSTTADSHYYFQNIAELTKLVWDINQVNGLIAASGCGPDAGDECVTIERLSHFVLFNDDGEEQCPPGTVGTFPDCTPVTQIPEPGSLALLGLGLGALAMLRRRRKA